MDFLDELDALIAGGGGNGQVGSTPAPVAPPPAASVPAEIHAGPPAEMFSYPTSAVDPVQKTPTGEAVFQSGAADGGALHPTGEQLNGSGSLSGGSDFGSFGGKAPIGNNVLHIDGGPPHHAAVEHHNGSGSGIGSAPAYDLDGPPAYTSGGPVAPAAWGKVPFQESTFTPPDSGGGHFAPHGGSAQLGLFPSGDFGHTPVHEHPAPGPTPQDNGFSMPPPEYGAFEAPEDAAVEIPSQNQSGTFAPEDETTRGLSPVSDHDEAPTPSVAPVVTAHVPESVATMGHPELPPHPHTPPAPMPAASLYPSALYPSAMYPAVGTPPIVVHPSPAPSPVTPASPAMPSSPLVPPDARATPSPVAPGGSPLPVAPSSPLVGHLPDARLTPSPALQAGPPAGSPLPPSVQHHPATPASPYPQSPIMPASPVPAPSPAMGAAAPAPTPFVVPLFGAMPGQQSGMGSLAPKQSGAGTDAFSGLDPFAPRVPSPAVPAPAGANGTLQSLLAARQAQQAEQARLERALAAQLGHSAMAQMHPVDERGLHLGPSIDIPPPAGGHPAQSDWGDLFSHAAPAPAQPPAPVFVEQRMGEPHAWGVPPPARDAREQAGATRSFDETGMRVPTMPPGARSHAVPPLKPAGGADPFASLSPFAPAHTGHDAGHQIAMPPALAEQMAAEEVIAPLPSEPPPSFAAAAGYRHPPFQQGPPQSHPMSQAPMQAGFLPAQPAFAPPAFADVVASDARATQPPAPRTSADAFGVLAPPPSSSLPPSARAPQPFQPPQTFGGMPHGAPPQPRFQQSPPKQDDPWAFAFSPAPAPARQASPPRDPWAFNAPAPAPDPWSMPGGRPGASAPAPAPPGGPEWWGQAGAPHHDPRFAPAQPPPHSQPPPPGHAAPFGQGYAPVDPHAQGEWMPAPHPPHPHPGQPPATWGHPPAPGADAAWGHVAPQRPPQPDAAAWDWARQPIDLSSWSLPPPPTSSLPPGSRPQSFVRPRSPERPLLVDATPGALYPTTGGPAAPAPAPSTVGKGKVSFAETLFYDDNTVSDFQMREDERLAKELQDELNGVNNDKKSRRVRGRKHTPAAPPDSPEAIVGAMSFPELRDLVNSSENIALLEAAMNEMAIREAAGDMAPTRPGATPAPAAAPAPAPAPAPSPAPAPAGKRAPAPAGKPAPKAPTKGAQPGGPVLRTKSGKALPPFWEERTAPDGRTYYVDHSTRTTHWDVP